MEMQDKFTDYPYTCKLTNSTDSCDVMIKVNSYINEIRANVQYISYSSNSLENSSSDDNNSNVKIALDNSYISSGLLKT